LLPANLVWPGVWGWLSRKESSRQFPPPPPSLSESHAHFAGELWPRQSIWLDCTWFISPKKKDRVESQGSSAGPIFVRYSGWPDEYIEKRLNLSSRGREIRRPKMQPSRGGGLAIPSSRRSETKDATSFRATMATPFLPPPEGPQTFVPGCV
jgi:hypothetical protein